MNYHNILHDDMMNGEGLRTVLFLSGCSHKCKGCQNPETWLPYSGIKFDDAAKKEIFEQLDKDYIHGITFSGGDPLHEANLQEVFDLITEIRKKHPNKTIWLYSGYTFEEIFNAGGEFWVDIVRRQTVKCLDVFVDGQFIKDLLSPQAQWVGSSNQRVIDIPKTLNNGQVILK